MKLAEKYGDRPEEEFPMLFQRILQNTIRDFYRRSKVRSMWTTMLSAFSNDDDEHDPLETLAANQQDYQPSTPDSLLLQSQTLKIIENELKNCHHVNAKPSSCVTGKNWMLPKLQTPWVAPREASKPIAQEQHIR